VNKILLVRYQCNIPTAPGAGSLYQDDPTEVGTKLTYYSVPFAPYARFDGIELPDLSGGGNNGHAALLTQQYIDDSSIVNSPFALSMTYGFNGTQDSITISATITAAQAYNAISTGSLKLQIAMEEAYIHFNTAPGSNGEKDFYDVMRKMVPGPNGTALNDTWANAATQTITQTIAIPTYIKNKNQICFVGWVQDDGNKRVHQAAFAKLNLDAGVTAVTGIGAYTCNTSFSPSVTVNNFGTTAITSYTINYKIDAGTAQTQAWTGNLAAGASTVVGLPSQTFTAGNHTITASTSMPNGQTDMFAGNDVSNTTFAVFSNPSGTPVAEGFVGTTYPPANWTLINADAGAYTWKRTTACGGYGASANSTIYGFYNNATDGDRDYLFLPYEDLTMITTPQLQFDYAYAWYYDSNYGNIYDSMDVQISTDCGNTWNSLWLTGGPGMATKPTAPFSDSNSFTPANTAWKTKTISLSSYASSTGALVRFVSINHYGNNLYLDNVNLSSPAGIASHGFIADVNVFPNPASTAVNVSVKLANSEKVTIALYNIMGEQVINETHDMQYGDNTVKLATDRLAAGVYSVLVSSANGSFKTKVTISK
jgi:hypothetical protein